MSNLRAPKSVRFISFVGAIFIALCGSATDYYVAKDGNDENPGTEEAPFLTISKAASVLQAGDVCYIKAGIYRETVEPDVSGVSGNPITFTSYPGDSVVVLGTTKVTRWEPYQGSIYRAPASLALDTRFRALYVNGKAMDIARWPNGMVS
nr:DUF1565 domain-containing protein [Microscilla sp. PRE1]